jgi:hypothetical protein
VLGAFRSRSRRVSWWRSAACGGNGGGENGQGSDDEPVQQALRLRPSNGTVTYVDWDPMRQSAGGSSLTAETSGQKLLEFPRKLGFPDSPYIALSTFFPTLSHRSAWGWNELDPRWQASVTSNAGVGQIFALEPQFDLSRIRRGSKVVDGSARPSRVSRSTRSANRRSCPSTPG